MTDQDPRAAATPAGLPRGLRLALLAALAVGAAAVLYMIGTALFHPGPAYVVGRGPAGASATVSDPAGAAGAAKVALPDATPRGVGELAPSTPFKDGDGRDVTLADFKGRVVVLNLWATWCAPCRKEMPTLAALAALEASKPVTVLPVSMDSAAKTEAAKAFIAQHSPLTFHQDSGTALPFALKPPAPGFPTTVIFDKSGRERARVAGDLDWSSLRVRRVLDALAAE